MKLPLSLINQFIELDESIEEISDAITRSGIEVDNVENPTPPFTNVVSAKILTKQKHPDADKLSLCKVTDGTEEYDIVCGAPNCKEGMIVALAKVGARLKMEDGSEFKIKKSKIRGIESFGMLCSKKELSISQNHDGILELPKETKIGQDLTGLLWDPVFELSLTPNLGHCFSALGVARELSCFLDKPLKPLLSPVEKDSSLSINDKLTAKIDSESCLAYSLGYASDIQVTNSPFWIKLTLERAGLRSINSIVDITNLVMLELGQPMHAFDYDLIEGKTIEVVDQTQQEKFVCLDTEERLIPEKACVIKDHQKPIAIGGIMGGENTSVTSNTKSIVLEAAFFDSVVTRKTARKMSLRTDSAQRFERKTDPEMTKQALERASFYLESLYNAKIAKDIIDLRKEIKEKEITLRVKRASTLLGKPISQSEIEEIFTKLGLNFSSHEEEIKVKVPSFRHDLNIEVDLVEEIARVYGYDNLKTFHPEFSPSNIPHSKIYVLENKLRELLIEQGLTEWLTCDLIGPKGKDLIHEKNIPDSSIVEVMHPKSIDYSLLRPTLLIGLLDCVKHNFSFNNRNLQAFEIGKAHLKSDNKFIEPTLFSIILTGKTPEHWDKKNEALDFYDLKGIVENIFSCLKLTLSFTPSDHPSFHPTRQANIFLEDLNIGVLGQLHPDVCDKMGIKEEVYFSEIEADIILDKYKETKVFQKLFTQPCSERDLTLTLDRKILNADVFKKIESLSPKILEKTTLIDLFEDDKLGENKKNLTIRFTYRDPVRTLAFEEVESAHQKLVDNLSFD